ncbi:MAG: cyclic nucleotide-binding domain-containing protein [Gemmatimonadales bacterium]
MPVDLLKESALFATLSDAQRAEIARICQTQTYKPGETIFKEGEPGNRLFLIAEGQVRISRDIPAAGEEALAILERPACFGEMSVFDRSTRSTDAYSNGGCTLVTISRPDLELLLEFDRELGYVIMRAMVLQLSARLRSANEQMRSLLAMSMF